MQRAPDDEVDARPVPQPGNQHRQQHVQVAAPHALAVTAQGDVDIVANEQRQADVPAAPEFLEVVRGIGRIEVLGQAEAQQQGNAGDQVGVAAEVEIDQEAVAIHAQQDLLGRIAARRFKHRVDPLAGQPGAAKEQLDHRQGDQAQSPLRLQHLTDTAGANLRQHVAGAVDRAGNQAGEERQVQGQVERRSRGHLAAVDRHQVADRVKGVERQADRHQHFQHRQ
ncbi:hypothetical protein D9M71_553940 [compost metagenome]